MVHILVEWPAWKDEFGHALVMLRRLHATIAFNAHKD